MTHDRQNDASAPRGRGTAGGRTVRRCRASPARGIESALEPLEAAWGGERLVIVEVPPLVPPAEMLSVGTVEVLCATAFTPVRIKQGTVFERCVRRIRRTVQEDYEVLCRDLGGVLDPAAG